MKLDRNENDNGRGKYALILLRQLALCESNKTFEQYAPEIAAALETLEKAGALDWGTAGTDAEFFLIRLKDRSAAAALNAYATDAAQYDQEWAREVFRLADVASTHPSKKTPD